jgi:hypothetical protein
MRLLPILQRTNFFFKKGEHLCMRIVYQNVLKRYNTHCVDETLNSNNHNKKEYDLLTPFMQYCTWSSRKTSQKDLVSYHCLCCHQTLWPKKTLKQLRTCCHELCMGHKLWGERLESTHQKLQLQDGIKEANPMEVSVGLVPLTLWEVG